MHPGDIVAGKFRVTRVLGRSRGLLLDARHTEFDQRVVIRLMSPALCDEKELERFRREARTLSKLESEHCARIIDVGTHSDGSFYLVRQYLDGVDLATHLRNQGALRLDQAVQYILQASEVVQECHSHNIVLREMQPAHLFLAQRRGGAPQIKVIDFGTAKLLKDASALGGDENQATAIFGISNYWSPELVRKSAVDARTDVWSLGCILYEMLAAVPAFTGEMAELMLKITRDDPIPISRLRPDLPRELDQIMGWALAKDANSRFTSPYALAHALRPYAGSEGQILVDQIGRIAHAAPAQAEQVAISPTSPLAAGHGALLDDDDESSSTVIMQSPAEQDFEKTAFMGDSPFAAMGGRSSVVPPVPNRGSVIPPPPQRQSTFPGAPASDPGMMFANGSTPSGMTTPASPNATGGFPAQTATGQHIKVRQRKFALVALGVAAIALPVLGVALFFGFRDPPQDKDKTVKNTTSASASKRDPVPDQGTSGGGETSPAASTDATEPANGSNGSNTVTPTSSGPAKDPRTTPSTTGSTKEPPSATVSAAPSVAPPLPPPEKSANVSSSQPSGNTGKLVGIASGGTCAWSVDGASQGTGNTFTVTTSVGPHTVSCTPPGQATRTQRKVVTADKPVMAIFKL
jgi:serine/threonine-protein kinase